MPVCNLPLVPDATKARTPGPSLDAKDSCAQMDADRTAGTLENRRQWLPLKPALTVEPREIAECEISRVSSVLGSAVAEIPENHSQFRETSRTLRRADVNVSRGLRADVLPRALAKAFS